MNMALLYTIITFISYYDLSSSDNETLAFNKTINNIIISTTPVNTSHLNDSAVINYLYGDPDLDDNTQYLDIFEPEETKRLIEVAQTKGELIEREMNNSRKYGTTPGYVMDEYLIAKTMDYMKQSVYGTRYRLKKTKYIRKAHANDIAYNLAILHGTLMQMRLKMDTIYTTLFHMGAEVKFLWLIVLYERCLATTLDVNSIVERMFALRDKHLQEMNVGGGAEEDYKKMNPPNPNDGTIHSKFPNS